MKFTINLSKKDFYHFQMFAMKNVMKSPSIKWKITLFNVVFWILLTVFFLTMYTVYKDNNCYTYEYLNKSLIALAIWYFVALIWQSMYMKMYVSEGVSENGSVLGKWEIELSDEAISEDNNKCKSIFKWSCIKSVEKDGNSLYLFTDKVKAIILPLNQISNEIEEVINKNVTNR